MPEMSWQNIDRISNDVRNQDISFSHLLDDLIDHICCDVEYEMQNGLGFSEAYRRVKEKMGKRRLKEIQEETLYAVDTKYRQMKNTMKISGIAGTVLLGFAALFKIQHWPLAGIMLTLGAVTLAFVFMPSALTVLWKETHSTRRLFLFISAFFAGMLFLMGILFKVQHWPGAGIILTLSGLSGVLFFIPALLVSRLREPENKAKKPVYVIGAAGLLCYVAGFILKIQHLPLASILMMGGLFILFIIVLPWYTRITWKEENHVKSDFIFMVIGSLAIIIPSTMISLNIQRSYEEGYFISQEQQKAVYDFIRANNRSCLEQYIDSAAYPAMQKLHSRTDDLLKLVIEVESGMIAESEGEPGRPVENPRQIKLTENGPEIEFRFLTRPFHNAPVSDFLLPGTASRKKLETAIADYSKYLATITPQTEFQKFGKMLDPSNCLPIQATEGREISMMSGLHSLDLLKNSLLTIESYALRSIAKH